jgi:hypothetical protein
MISDVSSFVEQVLDCTARASDVPAGAVFDAWQLRVLSATEFAGINAEHSGVGYQQLMYLACFGALAPTTHNTVPQRFCISVERSAIELWVDRHFVLAESDAKGRQATISCGCALAYIAMAAQAYGWQSSLDAAPAGDAVILPLADNGPRFTLAARLTFVSARTPEPNLRVLHAMLQRKSVRAEYDPQIELDDELVKELERIVMRFPLLRMHVLRDALTLSMFGKFQELADTTVYNRESFARELGQWLLPNTSTAALGMRGAEFGLADETALHFHRGLCGQEVLLPDEVAGFARSANRAIRSASGVIVLCAERDTPAARLDAGRAFAELSLNLHTNGFSTAMHAAVTEVEAPNMALRGRLRTTWRPVVVFRTGKVPARTEPRPHSSRPPLQELILDKPPV